MRPEVSIIMPVLNGQKYISEAMESIAAQTYPHHELIVVDDGSTDGTREIVSAFSSRMKIKYVRHEACQGIASSMNDGVRHATGDMIAFLDHDDAWFPTFLETEISHLESNPQAGMVHCDFQTTDLNGTVLEASVATCRERKRPSGHVFRELFMDSFIVGNSVLIRRECFDKLGLFDETLKWGDYHMWMRIARHYRVDFIPQVLVSYRQHPSQSTRSAVVAQPDADPVGLIAIRKILAQYPEIRTEIGEAAISKRISMFYFDLAYAWYSREEKSYARVCLHRALKLAPLDPRYWKLYLATFLSPSQVDRLRGSFRKNRPSTNGLAEQRLH